MNTPPIDPAQEYSAYFERFSFQMIGEAVLDCSHQGDCDLDTEAWEKRIDLSHISPHKIAAELREYGAWDFETELNGEEHDYENRKRIIWIAAGNIREEQIEISRE